MRLEVSGLPALPAGQSYTLWLTKNGALAESCGSFVVGEGTTKVPLNAPYRLRKFDSWVVVQTGTTRRCSVAPRSRPGARSSDPRAIVDSRDRSCS